MQYEFLQSKLYFYGCLDLRNIIVKSTCLLELHIIVAKIIL